MTEKRYVIAIVLFFITYILLLIITKYRAYTAFISAVIFVVFGALPINKIVGSVDWNALLIGAQCKSQ